MFSLRASCFPCNSPFSEFSLPVRIMSPPRLFTAPPRRLHSKSCAVLALVGLLLFGSLSCGSSATDHPQEVSSSPEAAAGHVPVCRVNQPQPLLADAQQSRCRPLSVPVDRQNSGRTAVDNTTPTSPRHEAAPSLPESCLHSIPFCCCYPCFPKKLDYDRCQPGDPLPDPLEVVLEDASDRSLSGLLTQWLLTQWILTQWMVLWLFLSWLLTQWMVL